MYTYTDKDKFYKDGRPKTCKFCRALVWWNEIEGRWYNEGGESLHTCYGKTAHYKAEAYERSQARRSAF